MPALKIRYLIPIALLAVAFLVTCTPTPSDNPDTGTDTNSAPVANSQAVETDEDTPLDITLSGSDDDGDDLTFTVKSQPAHGNLSGTAPDLSYTPDANFYGSDTFTFTVNDGTTDSAIATINVTVQAVNDAPVATDASESSYPGDTVTGTLQASDLEGDTLTFSIVSQGTKGVAVINDINTGAYTYSPNAGAIGSDSFTFKANDGKADSNIATITITDVTPATPTTGLGATAGDQRVTVNWDAVQGADSYTVYWSDTPGTGTGGTAVTGVQPPFYHDGRTNGSTYYYVVTAVNAAGESSASTEIHATPVNISLSSLTFMNADLGDCVTSASSGKTYVHELTSLTCNSKSIADITGLEALTSLTVLNLGINSISDLSPIQGLTNLTNLSLSSNSIDDIRPLYRLDKVTSLTVNNNALTDISGIDGMTSLTTLHIYANSIADISPLAGLTSLTELRIYTNNITNIGPLSGLSSLNTLMLDENNIVDVSPLSGISSLQYLYMQTNGIIDVSPLASLTGLKVLTLMNNNIGGQGIGNVDDLTALTAVNHIYISNNPGMSCAELTTLIAALGSKVDIAAANDGVNCTSP